MKTGACAECGLSFQKVICENSERKKKQKRERKITKNDLIQLG